MKTKWDHPRYQALLQLLRSAETVWNASRLFFERWELSPSQFNILNLLQDHPGGLSQSELGRLLITHRSNVTGLVDRLERRGLVRRQEAAADRRAYRVVLSPAGLKLVRQILPRYYQGAVRVWEELPTRRALELMADLQQAARNAERIVSELPKGKALNGPTAAAAEAFTPQ